MNAFSFNFSHGEVIRVRRDSIMRSWALAVDDHWVPLPWKETADAVCVMLWVKEHRAGASRVVSRVGRFARALALSFNLTKSKKEKTDAERLGPRNGFIR